jgi:hypothetical protein
MKVPDDLRVASEPLGDGPPAVYSYQEDLGNFSAN